MSATLITPEYAEMNRRAHEADPTYGTSAARHAELVLDVARAKGAMTLLDYGAGKQTLRAAVADQLEYRAYDPAVPAIAGRPEIADIVYCGDVMEHVEPDCTDAVLADVLQLARLAAVFVIHTGPHQPGQRMLEDGQPAHRNLRSAGEWWRLLTEHAPRRWMVASCSGDSPPEVTIIASRATAGGAT